MGTSVRGLLSESQSDPNDGNARQLRLYRNTWVVMLCVAAV